MLISFLLTAQSWAFGLNLECYEYAADQPTTVVLEQSLPEEALFWGWRAVGDDVRGLEDGSFLDLRNGWEAFGYRQAVVGLPTHGEANGWGWLAATVGADTLPSTTGSAPCIAGGTALLEGDTMPVSLVAEDRDGFAVSMALDRVMVVDGVVAISCEAVPWDNGEPLTVILVWLGGAT